MSPQPRLVIVRSLMAALGGYSLAALFTATLPRVLPWISAISRADASLYAMMLSFLIFTLWILYSFSAPSSRRIAIIWTSCITLMATGLLFEIPTA